MLHNRESRFNGMWSGGMEWWNGGMEQWNGGMDIVDYD
jgi:hypothetical protein